MRIRNVLNTFALSGLLLLTACNEFRIEDIFQNKDEKLIAQNLKESKEQTTKTITTIAKLTQSDKGFSTLASAIKATELKEKLNTEGPFTIFAPINNAFEQFSEGVVEKLLQEDNKDYLTGILNYHIIPSQINEKDIIHAIDEGRGSVSLKTLGGKKLTATLKGGSVFLIDEMGNGGKLITTDVEASNGLMHTIDAVMMPKK